MQFSNIRKIISHLHFTSPSVHIHYAHDKRSIDIYLHVFVWSHNSAPINYTGTTELITIIFILYTHTSVVLERRSHAYILRSFVRACLRVCMFVQRSDNNRIHYTNKLESNWKWPKVHVEKQDFQRLPRSCAIITSDHTLYVFIRMLTA